MTHGERTTGGVGGVSPRTRRRKPKHRQRIARRIIGEKPDRVDALPHLLRRLAKTRGGQRPWQVIWSGTPTVFCKLAQGCPSRATLGTVANPPAPKELWRVNGAEQTDEKRHPNATLEPDSPQPPLGLGPPRVFPRVASEGNPGLVCRTALPFPTRRLAEEWAHSKAQTASLRSNQICGPIPSPSRGAEVEGSHLIT